MMAGTDSSAVGEYATPLLAVHPHLLKNRNFLLLWAGNVISALGDRIHMLVMLSLVSKIVGDHLIPPNPKYEAGTMESAQLTVMMLSPFLLFGPITGLLADRFPRRAIMICSDLARVVIVIVARTIFLREQGTQANAQSEYVMLYGLLLGSEFILATFGAAFSPARMALLPQLVHPDQLLRANSLTTAAGTIASLLGFVAGGLLVTHSLHVAMYVDAGTFLVSAMCLAFMKLGHLPRHTAGTGNNGGGGKPGPLRDLAEGVAYIRGHRRVMQITWLLLLYWSCAAIILSGLTGIVTRYYHLPIANYGYFLGVIGLGMVLGASSVSLFRHGIPKEIGVAWAMVGVGGFLFAFAQMNHWQPALVLVTLAATRGAVLLVSLETLVQRIVPNHVRGRIMGVKDVITNIGMVGLTLPLAFWPDVDAFILVVLRILSGLVVVVGLGLVVYYYRRRPAGLHALFRFWVGLGLGCSVGLGWVLVPAAGLGRCGRVHCKGRSRGLGVRSRRGRRQAHSTLHPPPPRLAAHAPRNGPTHP
ncbi:MAG: MFS transporter, partial [Phycisphaerae bacterium]